MNPSYDRKIVYQLFVNIIKKNTEVVIEKIENDKKMVNMNLNKFQWTPLHCAAYTGNQQLVDYLLVNGANIDLRNENGLTASMLA